MKLGEISIWFVAFICANLANGKHNVFVVSRIKKEMSCHSMNTFIKMTSHIESKSLSFDAGSWLLVIFSI